MHITQPVSTPPPLYTHTHTSRAVFHRQGSASDGATSIPLNNIGESFWWLQFVEKDWKSLKIKHLKTDVPLYALLVALGAQPDDDRDGDDDSEGDGDDDSEGDGAASTLCLAPGPCLSGEEGGGKATCFSSCYPHNTCDSA